MISKHTYNIVFFGTPDIAVWVLKELERVDILPSLIVTNPDRTQGRKMILTPPPVKTWAGNHNIEVLQPETPADPSIFKKLHTSDFDLFIVVAYGKIIPKNILDIPKYGTINVHPSLLPKFRGASPIRSAILTDAHNTGITIMLLDEKMDHGPIIAQKKIDIDTAEWPMRGGELDEKLSKLGGHILTETIPKLIAGEIKPHEQTHESATFCKKIIKTDGEINLDDDPYKNLLKIRAYDGWPGTFFFTEKGSGPDTKKIRVKITDAELAPDGTLNILTVIPEGKKEILYTTFLKQY